MAERQYRLETRRPLVYAIGVDSYTIIINYNGNLIMLALA